jgi:outer membrane lipoprotein-sorting protein
MTRTTLARLAAILALVLATGALSACSQNGDPEIRRGTSGFYGGAGGGVNWR